MIFKGAATPLTQNGLDAATQLLGVGPAELWTLLSVETKGCGYLPDRRPLILFERHIFHRQTGGKYDASNPSVSSPTPGGYLGGANEYDRLEQAMNLDAHAALNSASWGMGQVMGFNCGTAGFSSVEAMVEAFVAQEDAHLWAVANWLYANKLHEPMAAHQWDSFAKGYNGENFAENHYDTRLAAAYTAFSKGPLPQIQVRQAQLLLTFVRLHPGAIDGIPGKSTLAAMNQFRQQQGLQPSNAIDGALIAALQSTLSRMDPSSA